jgi:hypothetical protein
MTPNHNPTSSLAEAEEAVEAEAELAETEAAAAAVSRRLPLTLTGTPVAAARDDFFYLKGGRTEKAAVTQ